LLAAACYEAAVGAADVRVARQRLGEGLAAVDRSIALSPDSSEAHVVRADILGELGRVQECLSALDEARRLGASDQMIFHKRALARMDGEPSGALADFDRALALNPDHVPARRDRGFLKLALGDLLAGWADHEWLRERACDHHYFMATAPQWQGEPLGGERLLVNAEHGLGDTFQFVRYLRLIENQGAVITLAVPEAARRLLAASFPGISVTGFDFHASLMSLPSVFGTTLETIPANVPYLSADAALVAKWRQIIGTEGFRVGIVWQGNPAYQRDRFRSIPLLPSRRLPPCQASA